MNIRKLANLAINIINKDVPGVWRHYLESTIDEYGVLTPAYEDLAVIIQVQSAPTGDVVLSDYIKQGATARKVYIYGNLESISRPNQHGGDLLIFPEIKGGPNRIWKIVNTEETWPDWCCANVILQSDEYTEPEDGSSDAE